MNREELLKMRKRHNDEIFSLLDESDFNMFKRICDKTLNEQYNPTAFTAEDFKDDVMSYGGMFVPNMEMFEDMGLIIDVYGDMYFINVAFKETIKEKIYGII